MAAEPGILTTEFLTAFASLLGEERPLTKALLDLLHEVNKSGVDGISQDALDASVSQASLGDSETSPFDREILDMARFAQQLKKGTNFDSNEFLGYLGKLQQKFGETAAIVTEKLRTDCGWDFDMDTILESEALVPGELLRLFIIEFVRNDGPTNTTGIIVPTPLRPIYIKWYYVALVCEFTDGIQHLNFEGKSGRGLASMMGRPDEEANKKKERDEYMRVRMQSTQPYDDEERQPVVIACSPDGKFSFTGNTLCHTGFRWTPKKAFFARLGCYVTKDSFAKLLTKAKYQYDLDDLGRVPPVRCQPMPSVKLLETVGKHFRLNKPD